MPCLPQIQQNN